MDPILPTPAQLYVKIRNTSAIPLRAAYLLGPYTLYTACYPSTFDPNHKYETSWDQGTPSFEPNLKAGGSWLSRLTIPENIREKAGKANVRRTTEGKVPSCTWIVEVSSQVIFSTSATVHFEFLVGRDEKSVELGFLALTGQAISTPGQLQDHQQGRRSKDGHNAAHSKGVFSKAVELVVDDTASLWNKPALPERDDDGKDRGNKQEHPEHGEGGSPLSSVKGLSRGNGNTAKQPAAKTRKKVHLVILTHGLHSNLGADMLYLKESIDAAAKQAREDARERKSALKQHDRANTCRDQGELGRNGKENLDDKRGTSTAPLSGGQDKLDSEAEGEYEDEEEVIVRGFSGNAVRTEKGIQYLGKRLAKYVLSMTYPDQPYLPVKKSVAKKISRVFTSDQPPPLENAPASHEHSSIHKSPKKTKHLAYQITSISFIAHSLGGLTQTYAIAYIHKHSPQFYKHIKPINFVTMASPFLGLSNENPLYVKFALDFGLVGRTGQDLGLTWRGSTMVRSGWGAMMSGIGSDVQRAHRQPDYRAKPLLRILPTGPAHQVLKMFRNRTVYSNVVNDGIVPLRTSCLLFLDWSGLGRVEKARRENGLVGTMAGWGWAELTGGYSTLPSRATRDNASDSQVDESGEEGRSESQVRRKQAVVPQPADSATDDDAINADEGGSEGDQPMGVQAQRFQGESIDANKERDSSLAQPAHPLGTLLSFLHPNQPKAERQSPKQRRIYSRSQTRTGDLGDGTGSLSESIQEIGSSEPAKRPGMVRGESTSEEGESIITPPKTTFFESAGDILNPPLPSKEFLTNPESRPRTIFHDRVYHPGDIPPPPLKKRTSLTRSLSNDAQQPTLQRSDTTYGPHQSGTSSSPDTSNMKVEEKIARAYHHDLSWRKVLVRLEPDAHNNIVVRRMFANAYGWPVIKHLVDTHFADTFAASTADELETSEERAKPMREAVGEHGEELKDLDSEKKFHRTDSEDREARDDVSDLKSLAESSMSSNLASRPRFFRDDSAQWDDALFEVTDDDEDIVTPLENRHRRSMSLPTHNSVNSTGSHNSRKAPAAEAQITDQLSSSPVKEVDGLDLRQDVDIVEDGKKVTLHGSTTSVGLGKAVEEQLSRVGSATRRGDEAGQGVGESVD